MKLTILHFQPIEGYPPIINLLSFLGETNKCVTSVFSTKGNHGYSFEVKDTKIVRFGQSGSGESKISRWFTYLSFNLGSLILLVYNRPSVILYFESISSWPACFYKKYLCKRVRLLIHYHEYTTPKEYLDGMALVRNIHRLETQLFSSAKWISHTNQYRLNKFADDEQLDTDSRKNLHVMPNYPPLSWNTIRKAGEEGSLVKLVYVGYSLSFDTMYVKELFDWVGHNAETTELDIYLYIIPDHIQEYVAAKAIRNVKIFPCVRYEELPILLRKYHIGVIIYKGTIENYVYIAPNKLFEYLTCGLDVWVPSIMTGSLEYVCEDAKPRVLALDFTKLDSYTPEYLFGAADLPIREVNYFCEPVYENLYRHLISEE